jgi:hypothetical protein
LSASGLIPELKEGRSVDLAVVTIGKRTTPREVATKKDLAGSCEGATHYVRSAWVGGIAAGMGKTGKPHTFDEVFTAATGASSTDEYKDGDFEPCRKATSDISTPPQRCSTAVRLELVAIDAADSKPFDEAAPRPQPCPEGMVLGAGKCALPETQKSFVCAATDAKECTEQCDKGDAESCYRLGMLIKNGVGGAAKSPRKARELFEKASTMGGSPRADFELGLSLY